MHQVDRGGSMDDVRTYPVPRVHRVLNLDCESHMSVKVPSILVVLAWSQLCRN